MHSTQSDALHLIMALIKQRLCRVNVGDVWSLFESTAIRPTAATLCFLATFLDEHGAPEHGRSTATVRKSVRSQLLNWLLCCRSELSDEEFVPATTHLDAKLASKVLVSLTVRDTRPSHQCSCSIVHSEPFFCDIEHLCLLSTFDDVLRLPSCIGSTSTNCRELVTGNESSSLYCRQEELIRRLCTDVDYSVMYAKPEVRSLHLNHCSGFLTFFISARASVFINFISKIFSCLQCFDAVGWVAGRASGL